MQSPESTMAAAVGFRSGKFRQALDLEQLRDLKRLVEKTLRDAEDEERHRLASCDPQELMPKDWGIYGVYEADFVNDADFVKATEVFEAAVASLDKAGCCLVEAIRREDMNQTKLAVRAVRILQTTHRELGATDTEGRHALQDVMARACNGSIFEFETLWDRV